MNSQWALETLNRFGISTQAAGQIAERLGIGSAQEVQSIFETQGQSAPKDFKDRLDGWSQKNPGIAQQARSFRLPGQ